MKLNDLRLLRFLCARLGIVTLKELEAFKLQHQASTNTMLLEHLKIYATTNTTYRKVNTV